MSPGLVLHILLVCLDDGIPSFLYGAFLCLQNLKESAFGQEKL